VRDGVEVAFQVGVHHKGAAFLEQTIDAPQRLFAAPTRPKAIALGCKFALEDRLDDVFQRRLHHPIAHRRDAQRTLFLAARFRDVNPARRVRTVAALMQLRCELGEFFVPMRLELRHTLAVHSGTALVAPHIVKRALKVAFVFYLIDQSEPFASFHSCFQCCQHAVRPDRGFHPTPSLAQGVSSLLRRRRHCRRSLFPRAFHLASTFLRPFAPADVTRLRSGQALMAFSRLACATMGALTPARRGSSVLLDMNSASWAARVSRVTRIHFDWHSAPNHPTNFCDHPLPWDLGVVMSVAAATAWLRLSLAGSLVCLAESSSLSLPTANLARSCFQPRLAATLLLCASCRFTVQQCGTFARCGLRLHGARAAVFNRRGDCKSPFLERQRRPLSDSPFRDKTQLHCSWI